MKKRNEFYIKQVRLFILNKEGKIDYYKDKILYRGTIKLTKDTKVIKTGKDRFEIHTPHRVYYLFETDSGRHESDNWIDRIREVIQ